MTITKSPLKLKEIYDLDFNQWIIITTNLLKENNFKDIDFDNLIIELESMGKSNKRELTSRLIILIMHLLKWKYQPQKQSKSWLTTINEQRLQLELLLEENPSLNREIEEIINHRYDKARKMASQETNLNLQLFPSENPFNLSQILNEDFFP